MKWTPEIFEKVLNDFLGEGDPRDPKVIKRNQILNAATDHFIRFGYRKTNIAEVAAQAGVAKGTVYLYFKSKPELLVFAIANEKKRYMGCLKLILDPQKTPRQRLMEWIRQTFLLGAQMPLTSRVLRGDQEILAALFEYIDANMAPSTEEMQYAFVTWLIEEVVGPDALDKVTVEERTKVLMALAYFAGMAGNERIRGGLSIEQFAGRLAEMLVNGVASSPETEEKSDKEA